jgi:hypothetical protein
MSIASEPPRRTAVSGPSPAESPVIWASGIRLRNVGGRHRLETIERWPTGGMTVKFWISYTTASPRRDLIDAWLRAYGRI